MSANHNARSDRATGAAVVVMAVCAVLITLYALRPPAPPPPIDTKREAGTHLGFVFIAPTSSNDTVFRHLVMAARDSMRAAAKRRGIYFTTVGISDHWDVEKGLNILRSFGWFDEVVVGRNWFNSGIVKYINDFSAIPGVPQVVVTEQVIATDSLPFEYSPLKIMARFIGRAQLAQWGRTGFVLTVSQGVTSGAAVNP